MSDKPARDMTAAEALEVLAPLGIHKKASGRVDLPVKLEGVTFRYKGKPNAAHDIDPRFAVFLVRLARFLHDGFGVVAIDHMGIYPAGYGQYSHDAGLAIDFGGVEFGDGHKVSVLNDWGNKPKKPGGGYRLPPSDPNHDFFKAIYDFTGREGDDRCNGTQTVIGMEDSFIRHPDLHDPVAAANHKNHLHLQAGQVHTGKTCAVPKAWSEEHGGSSGKAQFSSGSASGGGAIVLLGLAGLGAWWLSKR